MSGHSKWSTIKHQKGAADQKRGQAFSRLAKMITLAVKQGGSTDPESNFRLRMVIDKAKEINMPKDNILRAIERGSGSGGGEEVNEYWYEGFGPHQVALMIQGVSENTNRLLSQIKSYLDKRGLALGSPGSVSYLFAKKAQLTIAKESPTEDDQLALMDLNPDEVTVNEDGLTVIYPPEKLKTIEEGIVRSGYGIKETALVFIPKVMVDLTPAQREDLAGFINGLKEIEDVTAVFPNAAV